MVAKNIFPFATKTDGCKEANFMGFSHEDGILDTFAKKVSQKNVDLIEKFHEIYIIAAFSLGCIGGNILLNHDSWLQSCNSW